MGGAPPISAKGIRVAIHTICSATGRIGAAGAVICYFGSHIATLARAFYSHSPFFRGRVWQFAVGCVSVLENHLGGYACYIYGLCALPSILSLILRLLGIQPAGAIKGMGDLNAAKRPKKFARQMGAWLLLVPTVQVLLGALAGLMALVLVLVLLGVHAWVGCRRHGGALYLWVRTAVQIGARNAVARRCR